MGSEGIRPRYSMTRYLRLHEAFVRAACKGEYGPVDAAALKAFHDEQIGRMQHERLIHLLVTLACAAFLLAAIGFAALHPCWPALGLGALLLVLVCAYLVHYFQLENAVQRWYHLSNLLGEMAGRAGARYEDDRIRPAGRRPEA
ncbi:MAG: hypothetical protein JXR96_17490 [Deltaproteobacteria bacterium]|nr:hypothetical protein [Deltaproteobacteria bacterium]